MIFFFPSHLQSSSPGLQGGHIFSPGLQGRLQSLSPGLQGGTGLVSWCWIRIQSFSPGLQVTGVGIQSLFLVCMEFWCSSPAPVMVVQLMVYFSNGVSSITGVLQ